MTKPMPSRRFWSDESGATAVEYALLCGLMSAALVGVLATGGALETMYGWVRRVVPLINGEEEGAE